MLDDLFFAIGKVDWNDLAAVSDAAGALLTVLDEDREVLRALAEGALTEPHLLALCEHYDILDKLVLHDDPTGWRLRLHVFLQGYYDRPHNHRWTYASRILVGSYTHTLYGTDDQFGTDDAINTAAFRARMIRTERAGNTYVLDHTSIHSVTATPPTTSLIVRGPAVKDRFLVSDRVTGDAWWQYGAAIEDPTEAAKKRMPPNQVASRIEQLVQAGVLT